MKKKKKKGKLVGTEPGIFHMQTTERLFFVHNVTEGRLRKENAREHFAL